MRVHSSAPTRLDLAGGTLDIWPLYLFHDGSQTINVAINLRAECTLYESDDDCLHIISEDTGKSFNVAHWTNLTGKEEPRLVTEILRFFQAERLTVVTRSASPVGAGLAGSSALNIALCGALARWQNRSYSSEEIINLALNLEARVLRIPTGAQDYRPAMYGGLASIEFGPLGIRRTLLTINLKELEERITLVYTGISRNSGINNWEITKRYLDGDLEIIELFDQLCNVTALMRQALEKKDWASVGHQIAAEWEVRKLLTQTVSTPTIDKLIDSGINAGAQAAKICGAGGGGCILFYAEPDALPAVKKSLANTARVLNFNLDINGLCIDTD